MSATGGDLGRPISYMVLPAGTPVLSCDGVRIGEVDHVLSDDSVDVFDGIVVSRGPGRGHVFADADQVESVYERGVVLSVDTAECETLPQPSANPAVVRDDPADTGHSSLEDKLRRAWDRISGNY
jgi:uncharacterized protein YrrD